MKVFQTATRRCIGVHELPYELQMSFFQIASALIVLPNALPKRRQETLDRERDRRVDRSARYLDTVIYE